MIFYFSGTGNSKWIANQLSKEQQEDLFFIPDAWKNDTWEFSLREDEKIGFVFPVYSWAPPVIVQEFIRKLVLKGYQQQYLFFVCSCGDDTGLTRQVMEKALAARGWRCNAGFSVIMPNNYVLFLGFDVDSKELEKKKLAEAVPALEKVQLVRLTMIPECHKLFPVVNNGGHELLGFHAAEYGKYSVSGASRGLSAVWHLLMHEKRPARGLLETACLK